MDEIDNSKNKIIISLLMIVITIAVCIALLINSMLPKKENDASSDTSQKEDKTTEVEVKEEMPVIDNIDEETDTKENKMLEEDEEISKILTEKYGNSKDYSIDVDGGFITYYFELKYDSNNNQINIEVWVRSLSCVDNCPANSLFEAKLFLDEDNKLTTENAYKIDLSSDLPIKEEILEEINEYFNGDFTKIGM